MNKTVKHCAACQEDFGDRFSFCPVCGESLQVIDEKINQEPAVRPSSNGAHSEAHTAANVETNVHANGNGHREESVVPAEVPVTAPLVSSAPVVTAPLTQKAVEADSVVISEPVIENSQSFLHLDEIARSRAIKRTGGKFGRVHTGRGEYQLTMIQPPKSYGRLLTSGAIVGLFLMMSFVIGLFIYDIFSYPLDVAAIDEGMVLYSVYPPDDKPEAVEEIEDKDDDEGGGGGGGGRQNPKPPSKGEEAPQSPDPQVLTPSVNIPRMEKSALPQQATTVGPIPTERKDGPYGLTNSTSTDPSDGPGRGLGQGTGEGTGQGGGKGGGIGNGIGNGRGNGRGNGIGDGDGDGIGDPPPARKPYEGPASEPAKILSTSRGKYTEEARKNNVSGTVVLKITLSASGQVTNVSVVRGLPYGLTESAIAAARLTKFIPAKRNGQPVSTSRTMEIGFNIY